MGDIEIIAATITGDWPQHVKPGAGPAGRERSVAEYWARDPLHSAAHIVIGSDGTVACLADLMRDEAYHATVSNPYSVGIEVYQEADGGSGQIHGRGRLTRPAPSGACRIREVAVVGMLVVSRCAASLALVRCRLAVAPAGSGSDEEWGCGRRRVRSSGHRSGDLLPEVEELLARHRGGVHLRDGNFLVVAEEAGNKLAKNGAARTTTRTSAGAGRPRSSTSRPRWRSSRCPT